MACRCCRGGGAAGGGFSGGAGVGGGSHGGGDGGGHVNGASFVHGGGDSDSDCRHGDCWNDGWGK